MRHFLVHIMFTFLVLNTFAQDGDLVSRHRPGFMWFDNGMKPAILEKVRKYDRLIFDVVYNDWVSKSHKAFKVSPLSIGFNVNFMFDIPITKGNTSSFGIGFAYGLYRIRMNDFFVRNDVEGSTKLIHDISQYGIEKSVFKLNSLSIPFEYRLRGKNWKHTKLHFGAKASFFFYPSTTLSAKSGKIVSQQKNVGFYDFNHFNASAYLRFGIRNWSIFASYNFIPLFKDESSTVLNPIQAGVSISLY